MKEAIKSGFSFCLTSGVITTLGLIVGLYQSAGTKLAVVGGILTIAIADSFSDALGVNAATRSSKRNGRRAIFEATATAFIMKLVVALSFLVPIFFINNLSYAIKVDLFWGYFLTTLFSICIGEIRKEFWVRSVIRNLVVVTAVIMITYFVGGLIAIYFG